MANIPIGEPVAGLWHGYVYGEETFAAVCGSRFFTIDKTTMRATERACHAELGGRVSMFGFSEKLYILTGTAYLVWDGASLSDVGGYVPLVANATPPEGGGVLQEQVNKLTGSKRQRFSPDGTLKTFQLAETYISGVDYVLLNNVSTSAYTVNEATGVVTMTSVPDGGTDTLEIGWTKGTGDREKVTGMRFSETYNGATDARIFLYGDGTNQAVYSGLDYYGQPTAEYFPDLNVMGVDAENTPITGLIRHYNRLLAFKPDGCWSISYDTITLADGSVTAAFYVRSINKEIGNAAAGQVQLVENNPLSLYGSSVYEWKQYYSSATRDERNARRVSDRMHGTLRDFDFRDAVTFDDPYNFEYWAVCAGKAAVYNYAVDAWYLYTGIPATCFVQIDGEVYFGTDTGRLAHFSRDYRSDDGEAIDARWESGSMSFDADYKRKFTGEVWVSLKPEAGANVTITAHSNNRCDYPEKSVSYRLLSYLHMNYGHFSYNLNRRPQVHRIKLKVKKFTFYKLVFSSLSVSGAATILGADFRVRYTGNIR